MAANEYMTPDEFAIMFPEFGEVDPRVVELWLESAETHVAVRIFGDYTREAHGLATADALARSPHARGLKLAEGGKTDYGERFQEIRSACSPKAVVL